MKETDDLLIKTGAKLQINDASDTKNYQVAHNGTNLVRTVSAGDVIEAIESGRLWLQKAGVNSEVRIWDTSVAKYIQLYYDGANFAISYPQGDLTLTSGSNIFALQNLMLRSGKHLLAYDAGNTNYTDLYNNGTAGYLHSSVGALKLSSIGNEVVIWRSGVTMTLKVYDSAQAARINILHTATDGTIENNVGELNIIPATNLNLNNKPITNVNDFTFAAVKTGYININALNMRGFYPADEAFRSNDGGSYGLRNSDGAFARHDFSYNPPIPNGVIITALRVRYKRNDAASSGQVTLTRINNTDQTTAARGAVTLTDATGANVEGADTGISAENVNLATYSYSLQAYIDNNDNVADIAIVSITIEYTYQKILC
jgi:hypothetical protein